MEDTTRGAASPCNSGVVQSSARVYCGHENTRDISPQLSRHDSVWTDKETWPATFLSRAVGTTNPDVIVCGVRSHRGRHCYRRNSRALASICELPNIILHFLVSATTYASGVIRVEHQLNTFALISPVHFGVSVVVANLHSTPYALYREKAKVIAGGVMLQVAIIFSLAPRAKHFVVAIYEFTVGIDDVQGIMRLVRPRKPVAGAEDNPYLDSTSETENFFGAFFELFPIETSVRLEIRTRVARKSAFRKMHHVCTSRFRLPNLTRNVTIVPVYVRAHWKLTGSNFELHRLNGKISDGLGRPNSIGKGSRPSRLLARCDGQTAASPISPIASKSMPALDDCWPTSLYPTSRLVRLNIPHPRPEGPEPILLPWIADSDASTCKITLPEVRVIK